MPPQRPLWPSRSDKDANYESQIVKDRRHRSRAMPHPKNADHSVFFTPMRAGLPASGASEPRSLWNGQRAVNRREAAPVGKSWDFLNPRRSNGFPRRFRPLHYDMSGDDRARTDNPRLAKPVLSQLSYVPAGNSSEGAQADAQPLVRSSSIARSHRFPHAVGAPRVELGTSSLSATRSNQLSYAPENWPFFSAVSPVFYELAPAQ